METREYIHIEPGQENRAIAGYYEVEEEFIISLAQERILCILGYVCWDNTCCGAGGCRYVNVPGYILDYKDHTDPEGRPVSRVRRVTNNEEQKTIRDILKRKIGSLQIIDF